MGNSIPILNLREEYSMVKTRVKSKMSVWEVMDIYHILTGSFPYRFMVDSVCDIVSTIVCIDNFCAWQATLWWCVPPIILKFCRMLPRNKKSIFMISV